MDAFSEPAFADQIVELAMPYGGLEFWSENLSPRMNPDATWRALMLVGCMQENGYEERIKELLIHPDSRVRAWACFALGRLGDEASVEQIRAMNADPSNRVRIHAWQAIRTMIDPDESLRLFPIRVPQSESLILVSEDSKTAQSNLDELFSRMGFPVVVASTERQTLDAALRLRPGAVITDNQKGRYNLSGLNLTWDLCRIPELRETTIFMLTADSMEAIFLWNGGDYFLSKLQFNIDELVQVANEYLHH